MKKWIYIIPVLCFLQAAVAQAPATVPQSRVAEQLAASIQADDIKRHLLVLASDEYEGRETGAEGQKKAARYIAGVFEGYGLPKIGDGQSYFQKISFISETWDKIGLSVGEDNFRHLWDYYSIPQLNGPLENFQTDEILFLGYGIDDKGYSDYAGAEVKDKVILIYDGEPFGPDSLAYATGGTGQSEWSKDVRKKLRVAYAKGVKLVLIIDTDFKRHLEQVRKQIINTNLTMGNSENPETQFANSIYVNSDLARKIVGKAFREVVKSRDRIQKKGKGKPVTFSCKLSTNQRKRSRSLEGENVLGFIEGTDPQLKNEILVISAHYDHLGKRGDDIYHGADDNGSGTSSVLDIAQAFVEAKKQGVGPRRSVLILLVSGEEKGLLGSEYYAAHPVFPLSNTIADLNVDMIGRTDPKHKDNAAYVYVIGADKLSSELHTINETANKTYTQLELDYTYNNESDPNRFYYRSDHYNFARNGIPVIFYFSGTHEDYHRTTDTVDKIMFDKAAVIARLVFYTAWELANRDQRIVVDKKQ